MKAGNKSVPNSAATAPNRATNVCDVSQSHHLKMTSNLPPCFLSLRLSLGQPGSWGCLTSSVCSNLSVSRLSLPLCSVHWSVVQRRLSVQEQLIEWPAASSNPLMSLPQFSVRCSLHSQHAGKACPNCLSPLCWALYKKALRRREDFSLLTSAPSLLWTAERHKPEHVRKKNVDGVPRSLLSLNISFSPRSILTLHNFYDIPTKFAAPSISLNTE